MLNHIVTMGRLVRDPELRHTQSGIPVTSFTIACDRDYKDANGDKTTDFIDIVAWHNTARLRVQVFHQGTHGRHRWTAPAPGLDRPEWKQTPQRRNTGEQRPLSRSSRTASLPAAPQRHPGGRIQLGRHQRARLEHRQGTAPLTDRWADLRQPGRRKIPLPRAGDRAWRPVISTRLAAPAAPLPTSET